MPKRTHTTTFGRIPEGTYFRPTSGITYRKIAPTRDSVGQINARATGPNAAAWIDNNARVTITVSTKRQ
jgi:hypothetical protein